MCVRSTTVCCCRVRRWCCVCHLACGLPLQEEFEVLLDILEDYGKYLEFHPNSLLTRYFGCYSLHMFNSVTYFVVMENVFFNSSACAPLASRAVAWCVSAAVCVVPQTRCMSGTT